MAGTQAAAQAVAGRTPALLMVYTSPGYDLVGLLEGVREKAAAETVIVGCTTVGQVTADHPDPAADGVVVAALGGSGLQIRAAVGREVSTRRREAGAEAAGSVLGVTSPHRVCMILCDGLVGDQHEVVRGAYGVLGAAVPLVGGCAGDDLVYARTHQFIGDRNDVEILTDAAVSVGIGSTEKLGIGIAHGWRKVGDPMVVTRSSGGRLFELDGGPALDAYLSRIGADRTLLSDPKAFRSTVFSSPLGMSRRTGEDIRVVHDGDVSEGSLVCLADVPQGALAWIMEADDNSMIDAGAASCAQAVENLGGAAPVGLLIFDCGARKLMLGPDGVRQEVVAMATAAGPAPMAGFYTYGEIARTQGSRGMHHLTVVTLALA
ncbi:MAG TPA: FIST N-terminal domain-containing protein [Micromonosporaceae bacterium]|nr:FIST N-terminal domain-containing protein [Micromonosporaceae bacterium]